MTRDLPMEDDDPGAGDHAEDTAYRVATGVARVARAGAYVTGGALIASNGSPAPTNESHTSRIAGWVSNDPQPDAPSPVVTYPDPDPDSVPPPVLGGSAPPAPAPTSALPWAAPHHAVPPQQQGGFQMSTPDGSMSGGGYWYSTPLGDGYSPTVPSERDESPSSGQHPGTGHGDSDAVPFGSLSNPGFGLPGLPGLEGWEGQGFGGQGFDLPGYLRHPTQSAVGDVSSGTALPSAGRSETADDAPDPYAGVPHSATSFGPGLGLPGTQGLHLPGMNGLGAGGFGGLSDSGPETGHAFDGVGDGPLTGVFFHTESNFDAHIGLDGVWVTSGLSADIAVGNVGQQLDSFGDWLGHGADSTGDTAAADGVTPLLAGLDGQAAVTPGAAGSVPGAQQAGAHAHGGGPVAGVQQSGSSGTGSALAGAQGAQAPGAAPGMPGQSPAAGPAMAPGPMAVSPAPLAAAAPLAVAAPIAAPAPMAAAAPIAAPAPASNIAVAQPIAAAPAPAPPPVPAAMIPQPVAATPIQPTHQPDAAWNPIADVLNVHPGLSPLIAPGGAVPSLFDHLPGHEPGPGHGGAGTDDDWSGTSPTSLSPSPTGTPSTTPHAGPTSGGVTTPSHSADPSKPDLPTFGPGKSTTVAPTTEPGATRPDGTRPETTRPETTKPGTSTNPGGAQDTDDATVAPTVTRPRGTDSDQPGGVHRPTGSDTAGPSITTPTNDGPTTHDLPTTHDGPGTSPTRDVPSHEPSTSVPTTMPSHAPTVPSISRPVQPDPDDLGGASTQHTLPQHTPVKPPTTADLSPNGVNPVKPIAYEADSYAASHYDAAHATAMWPPIQHAGLSADSGALSAPLLPDASAPQPHHPIDHHIML
ncbi:hypothetical protein [Nocardia thraciensis]